MRSIREQAPDLEIELVPLTSAEQVEGLHEGALDIGIVRGEAGTLDLEAKRLYEEEIVACLPEDHPLAANESVSAADLSREAMIFFPARDMSGFVAEIRPIFDGIPFPRVRTRVVHQETALGFVAAGVGFTLLPESVSSFMPSSVRVVRIDSHPTTVMYVAEPRTLTPAARLFRRNLFDAAAVVSASTSAGQPRWARPR